MLGMASVRAAKAAEVSASVPPRRGQPSPQAQRKASAKTLGGTSPGARPAEIDISQLEFVGCDAVPMTREQYHEFEDRLEVWDAELKTAWIVRDGPMPAHEGPGQSLGMLAARIAAVRGSPIKCYGAMVLMAADARGEPKRLMQADQTLYIDPERTHLVGAKAMLVGGHNFPDVVLEVDHTTDVRRGKLRIYEAWGFPELWVDVPDARPASRPKSRSSGLTIHLLEDGAYQPAEESRAFPGWRAPDIHAALNEIVPSLRTNRILERLGRDLGARDGTGPDDDPLMRSLRRESEERGLRKGRAEGQYLGRVEGERKGRMEGRVEMVRELLLSRGVETSEGFLADRAMLAELPVSAVLAAALACKDEQDFLQHLASIAAH